MRIADVIGRPIDQSAAILWLIPALGRGKADEASFRQPASIRSNGASVFFENPLRLSPQSQSDACVGGGEQLFRDHQVRLNLRFCAASGQLHGPQPYYLLTFDQKRRRIHNVWHHNAPSFHIL